MRRCGRWAVVALSIGLFACGPGERPIHVYYEDFETVCEGAPCGWERSSGDADQATWVETIHPGEHALRLTGEVGVRGPSSGPMDRAAMGGAIRGCVVARCDPGSTLQLDVIFDDAASGLVTGGVSFNAPDEWAGPTSVNPMLDATITTASVTAVVITKTGSGACEIGEIVLDDSTFFFGGDTCQ